MRAAGYRARGDAALLRREAEQLGLQVHIVELRDADDEALGTASSTSVRQLVADGNVEPIRQFLGRDYALSVPVEELRGHAAGPGFDFARDAACNQVPADGAYAVRIFSGAGRGGAPGRLTVQGPLCRVCASGPELGDLWDGGHMRLDLLGTLPSA